MTTDERSALLLAARLLESGVPLAEPGPIDAFGHVRVGLTLAERLQRVADCPERAGEIVASLRAAAATGAEVAAT